MSEAILRHLASMRQRLHAGQLPAGRAVNELRILLTVVGAALGKA
jgi:hypothetical protein